MSEQIRYSIPVARNLEEVLNVFEDADCPLYVDDVADRLPSNSRRPFFTRLGYDAVRQVLKKLEILGLVSSMLEQNVQARGRSFRHKRSYQRTGNFRPTFLIKLSDSKMSILSILDRQPSGVIRPELHKKGSPFYVASMNSTRAALEGLVKLGLVVEEKEGRSVRVTRTKRPAPKVYADLEASC